MGTRAIVLGGGGVTGIGWEIGILAGLANKGFDLRADAVFGTSAGAFVGATLASGADLQEALAGQREPAGEEQTVQVPKTLLAGWVWAYLRGFGRPERIGAGMGAISRRREPLNSESQRQRTVEARLVTAQWPEALRVTALDARSGQLHVFDHTDGCSLADAVAASGAVPGVSPPVTINGHDWIDGGMVSPTNALLAEGFDNILVLAPLPKTHGGVPNVYEDVRWLREHSSVHLIVPDTASRTAIGPNIYDHTRRTTAADAGHAQAWHASEEMWR